MDFQETPDLDFSEPFAAELDANNGEETPNLVFAEEVKQKVATEEDDIDDLDEPDQYVESGNEDADEPNINEAGTGLHHTRSKSIFQF